MPCTLEGFKLLLSKTSNVRLVQNVMLNQCTVIYVIKDKRPMIIYIDRKKYQMPTSFYNKKASTRNRKRFLQLDKNYI